MPAILAGVLEIFALLSNVASTVGTILGIVGGTAQEHARYAIEKIAANTANTVNSPTFGNAALLAAIADAKAQGIADTASLLVAIGDLTDGTTPVSLPVVPPSGYSAPSGSSVASDVWHYHNAPLFAGAANYLQAAGNWGAFSANLRWLGDEVKYFEALYGTADFTAGASDWVPVFDPTDILIGEDALTCLTRQNPGWTVSWAFATDGYVRLLFPGTAEIQEWQTTFDETGFELIKARIFPVSSIEIAPNWPGIAKVTLGTPVAITPGLTITTPMDGVIVTITSVTANKPSLAYGAELAYKFIGGLSFVSDNGQVEPFQQLAFTNALYCPREMTRAASVVLRADLSVVGTITPWVIA